MLAVRMVVGGMDVEVDETKGCGKNLAHFSDCDGL